MKIVINKCYGGFSLSHKANLWLYENGLDLPDFKMTLEEYYGVGNVPEELCESTFRTPSPCKKYILCGNDIPRDNALLVKCVEELGIEAGGSFAELEVVEIPDNVEWEIDDYDGMETVEEKHRTWG